MPQADGAGQGGAGLFQQSLQGAAERAYGVSIRPVSLCHKLIMLI